jgi:SAM-dependent methyltransferase
MNLDAVWHDLECGAYGEDLALWRDLAARTGGPVLDVGAGTGRVTLALAEGGVEMVGLDVDEQLLDALAVRATGLPVETVVADARELSLGRRFPLILVPMQTLQLLGGAAGRAAFLRRALDHLEPGGLLAAALADAMDCFDDDHETPPPPDAREILGIRYASQLLGVVDDDGRAAVHRRREVSRAPGRTESHDVVVHLDRVSADEVATEARALGFSPEPHLYVPETEQYLGSTVVVLRAPTAGQPGWRSTASTRARAIASAPASPTSNSGRIVPLAIRSTAGKRRVLVSTGSSAMTVVSPPSGSVAVAITVSEPPASMFRAEASSLRALYG